MSGYRPQFFLRTTDVTGSITLKAGGGISLDTDNTAITTSGTRTITNTGVRSATKKSNGVITINTNGTSSDVTVYSLPTATSDVLGGIKVGSNLSISNGVLSGKAGTVTSITLKAGTGISLDTDNTAITSSGTRTITNAGVRSIATGSSNGTISVNTNGTTVDVTVNGLGSNAYTSTAYLPLSGGTMTGALNFADGTANTVGNDVKIGDFNIAGTLGILGVNGVTAIGLLKQGATWGNSADYAKISYDGTSITLSKQLSLNDNGYIQYNSSTGCLEIICT